MDAPAMPMPVRALLTEREALNWIAFGNATADLIGWESVNEKWSVEGPGEIRGIVEALRAAESGQPFAPNGTVNLMHYEERARALVEKMGRPAAELADTLQGELTALDGRRAALQHAESVLAEAVIAGRAKPVKPPDLAAYRGRGNNIVWYRKPDVLRLWPMPVGNPDAARAKPTDQTVFVWLVDDLHAARDRGASPPKLEKDAFPRCKAATGARHAQMRAAVVRPDFPADLKRRRGKPGK